jgi:hypothetical protein
MSWPGHDDAPHFQTSWLEHPRLKGAINTVTTLAHRNRRIVVVLLSAALIVGSVALGPKIKNSIIRTLERVGQSAQLQGRAFSDMTQPSVEKSRTSDYGAGPRDR